MTRGALRFAERIANDRGYRIRIVSDAEILLELVSGGGVILIVVLWVAVDVILGIGRLVVLTARRKR